MTEIFARSLQLNTQAAFPLKMRQFVVCEHLCQETPPKRTKHLSGDNGCYYQEQHFSLSFFFFNFSDFYSSTVRFNGYVRFPAIQIKRNSLGQITLECPYDFMLFSQPKSTTNVSFPCLLPNRCQLDILVRNECVPGTGVFGGPSCDAAFNNQPLL